MSHRHRTIRTLFSLTLAALVIAACGPTDVYYREGANVQRLDEDKLSCQVAALRDAPVSNQIRQQPPTFRPGQRICVDGTCWTAPGYWEDGRIYTVDVNLGLRQKLEQSCMASKDYQQVPLKRCTMEEAARLLPRQSATLPPLTEGACVWRSPDGDLRILSP